MGIKIELTGKPITEDQAVMSGLLTITASLSAGFIGSLGPDFQRFVHTPLDNIPLAAGVSLALFTGWEVKRVLDDPHGGIRQPRGMR